MSCRARRIPSGSEVSAFEWTPLDEIDPPATEPPTSSAAPAGRRHPAGQAEFHHAPEPAPVEAAPRPESAIDHEQVQRRLAELEREAFTKGYASGEQAGLEAGTTRADAMIRRLGETLTELDGLRQQIVAQTERQMVQIALAVARRILRREASMDQDLVVAIARVALDRLGDQVTATVRLHPDDCAAVAAKRGSEWAGSRITVVADPGVSRGGCRVESDLGFIDAGVDAQFEQLVHALLGEPGAAATEADGHLLAHPVP